MDAPVLVESDFAVRIAQAAGPGASVTAIDVMPGGHSGLTHRVSLEGLPGRDQVVVKSTPPGRRATGRHDVLRQARILRALATVDGVPVPEVCFADASDPPFFGTALLPGVAVDPVIDMDRTEVAAEEVATRWEAAMAVVAALHAVAPVELAERPRDPGEELEIWEATMRAARFEDDHLATRLADAMRRDVPALGEAAIVHGDFRLGNILFEGGTPHGVIDWEIWSVGDAAVDLGWFIQFTDPGNFPGIGREVPGTPSADEVLRRYALAGGAAGGDLAWFVALGCFKLAAIQAHNRRRHIDGRYHDPYQALLAPSIVRLLERGLEHLA